MTQKRVQVRVPIKGQAILSAKQDIRIKANAKDISQGGLGLSDPSESIDHSEYLVEISTEEGRKIQLKAILVHNSGNFSGFKTSTINEKNLEIITDLIAAYQISDDVISQIDKYDFVRPKMY